LVFEKNEATFIFFLNSHLKIAMSNPAALINTNRLGNDASISIRYGLNNGFDCHKETTLKHYSDESERIIVRDERSDHSGCLLYKRKNSKLNKLMLVSGNWLSRIIGSVRAAAGYESNSESARVAEPETASLLSISVSFMSSSSTLSELSPLSASSMLLLNGMTNDDGNDEEDLNNCNQSGEDKHVMFADSVGLQLELIHTIQPNSVKLSDSPMRLALPNEAISRRSSPPLDIIPLILHNQESQRGLAHASYPSRTLIAKFKLRSNETYESLMKNGEKSFSISFFFFRSFTIILYFNI
jgi:hypothetical protein